jgi:hypothetical protein
LRPRQARLSGLEAQLILIASQTKTIKQLTMLQKFKLHFLHGCHILKLEANKKTTNIYR